MSRAFAKVVKKNAKLYRQVNSDFEVDRQRCIWLHTENKDTKKNIPQFEKFFACFRGYKDCFNRNSLLSKLNKIEIRGKKPTKFQQILDSNLNIKKEIEIPYFPSIYDSFPWLKKLLRQFK